MPLGHLKELTPNPVTNPAAKDAAMRVLVGPEQGWSDHVMRVFDLQPGGFTPKHQHDWPHINYIIAGEGTLFLNDQENPIQAGSYAYVPAVTPRTNPCSSSASSPPKVITKKGSVSFLFDRL
jgi:quercetin dioxygenase-like cupin family protein